MNRITFTLLLLAIPFFAGATSIFDLLQRAEDFDAVPMTLTLPMDSILAKVQGQQKATIDFEDNAGDAQHWGLKVSVRGRFRRYRCGYAPLKFNFGKKKLTAAGLTKHDKYKLVTACFDGPDADALVMKEYLAYKAYNLLTPQSFRVQLLELTYRDAAGKHPDRTVTAFLIEDTDEMAARIGGEEVDDLRGLPASAFDTRAEVTHALFQYLLGNGDWSLPLLRNVKMVRMPNGKIVPVGYDFDFTGWVGAPYATPSSSIGQTSIYERVYLGYGCDDAMMREVSRSFREQRRAITGLVNRSPLEATDREVLWRFAARFFTTTNRMTHNDRLPLYDQLRGATAAIIPPGAAAESYRMLGK